MLLAGATWRYLFAGNRNEWKRTETFNRRFDALPLQIADCILTIAVLAVCAATVAKRHTHKTRCLPKPPKAT